MAQARHLRSTPAAVLSTLVDSDAAANQHLSEALQGLGDRSTQQQMEPPRHDSISAVGKRYTERIDNGTSMFGSWRNDRLAV